MTIHLHDDDLPLGAIKSPLVAIDTETMGLIPARDRLCLIQLSAGDGEVHLVRFHGKPELAVNLKALLVNPDVIKIFHYARFDIAMMSHYLGVMTTPLYCTKIASRLVRTYTDRHGLKDLCKELLGVELSKQEQTTDWGRDMLTPEQMKYAASDVLHLHALKERLDLMLAREGRTDLAQACFDFLPHRARLDLLAGEGVDIFQH